MGLEGLVSKRRDRPYRAATDQRNHIVAAVRHIVLMLERIIAFFCGRAVAANSLERSGAATNNGKASLARASGRRKHARSETVKSTSNIALASVLVGCRGRRPLPDVQDPGDVRLLIQSGRRPRLKISSVRIELLCFSPRCPQTVLHGAGLRHHSCRGAQRSRGTPCAASVLG
jgi:hypothetical protein